MKYIVYYDNGGMAEQSKKAERGIICWYDDVKSAKKAQRKYTRQLKKEKGTVDLKGTIEIYEVEEG